MNSCGGSGQILIVQENEDGTVTTDTRPCQGCSDCTGNGGR